jgi:hypothetical protein
MGNKAHNNSVNRDSGPHQTAMARVFEEAQVLVDVSEGVGEKRRATGKWVLGDGGRGKTEARWVGNWDTTPENFVPKFRTEERPGPRVRHLPGLGFLACRHRADTTDGRLIRGPAWGIYHSTPSVIALVPIALFDDTPMNLCQL